MFSKKIALLISFLFLLNACADTDSNETLQEPEDGTENAEEQSLNAVYSNAKYNITIHYPEAWSAKIFTGLRVGRFAVNIFKSEDVAEQSLPLAVYEEMEYSYVAVWPEGLATELPASHVVPVKDVMHSPALNFAVNRIESKLLLLKDGSIWGYFLVPRNPPEAWSDYGFIYAQVGVKNVKVTCFEEETGQEITLEECDNLEGDRVVRTGQIDEEAAATIRNILENIRLEPVEANARAADFIEITNLQPNATVASPLTIKGKAKGMWYFEGSFAVELVNAEGNTLAKEPAQAKGKWMIEKLAAFTATLTFETAEDEHGKVIFHRANPSGLAKNEMTYSIPVTF